MPTDESMPGRKGESESAVDPDVASYITAYVDRLKEKGVLNAPDVERAFRRAPRHMFVSRFFVGDEQKGWTPVEHDPTSPRAEHLKTIYSEAALITRLDGNLPTSSTSQPGLVAEMLQLLELRSGMRALEIGTGTGHSAALMAEIVGDPSLIVTIDLQNDVVQEARQSLTRAGYAGVTVLCRDGFDGAPESAPFDRIVATVGCPDLSPSWVDQLAPSGFMLIPLRHAWMNPLVRVWREGRDIHGRVVGSSGFMGMQGRLWDPNYFDFTPARVDGSEGERALWPELVTAKDSRQSGRSRTSFLFFLGLRDQRTRMFQWLSRFGLEDKPSGRTARVEADRLAGDFTLLDELETLYREWKDLGAPDITRFLLRFVPVQSGDHAAPSHAVLQSQDGSDKPRWRTRGPHFWREFSLSASRQPRDWPASPSPPKDRA